MATNKDFIVKNGLSVGGDVAITGNVTSDLHLNDNAKIKVGTATDGDLQIYHNVNNSFIEDVGTGSLYLRADASVRIQSYGDNNDMIKADKAGAVTLYHNNGSRLDTTASGVNVTGTVDMDGFTSVGNGVINGDLLIQEASGFPRITLQDLDGTNTRSFINHSASDLTLTSQNDTSHGRIIFSRYDGTTTATSGYFDATGKFFASSDLDVSGNVVSSGNISAVNTTLTGYLRGPASFTIDPAAHGDDTGTVIIAGNLQVDGTQTTINSTSLTVDDLNLTLASGAADSAAANGAGITVDGASASLTYAHSGTKFVFNKPLDVTGNIGVTGTVDGVDIAARDAVLTSTTTTANAALPKAGGTMTGSLRLNDVAQSIDFIQSGAINFDSNGDQTGRVLTIGSNRADGASGGTSNVTFYEDGTSTFADNVNIGAVAVQGSKLRVSGKIVAGDEPSPNGDVILEGYYNNGATVVLGSERSSGGAFLGYGVQPSATTQHQFLSSTPITITHGAYVLADTHRWWTASSGSAVATGSQVTTMTQRMTILANGNVGIGTASPNATLSLSNGSDVFDFGVTANLLMIKSVTADGSDDHRIILDAGNGGQSSTRGAYLALSGNEAGSEAGKAIYQMGNVTGSSHLFRKAGGIDAVIIDSDGNVGIGTSSPASPLHVKKTGSTSAVQEFLRLENHALGGAGAGSSINFHHYHAGAGPAGGALAASINAQNMASWPAGSPSSYSTGLTFSTLHENTFAERMRIESNGDVNLKSAGVVTLKASPLGSTYGAGFNVMTVTGTSSSPYTSTIGFSNYSETNAMVIKGDKVGIGVDPTTALQVSGEILATNVSFTDGSGSSCGFSLSGSMADMNCGTKGLQIRGDGGFIVKNMNNNPYISAYSSQLNLYVSAQAKLQFTATEAKFTNHVYPVSDNAIDLGSTSLRWRNVYTTDLHLSNEGKPEGNEVDGTTGNWTIQEGDENLYILNNKTGKKYKFALEEIT